MPANKISVDNAKQDKLFYFVANILVYRESDGRCLILKRSEEEKVHPGRYATPGGKLEWKDLDLTKPSRINGEVLDYQTVVEDLLRRETREEAGIEIGDEFVYINSMAFIRPDETPVVMIKLAAKYRSGEVHIEEGAFTDFAWVTADEARKLPCVDGIVEEIEKATAIFNRTGEAVA